MLIPWVLVGAAGVLVARWIYVWQHSRLEKAAFEYRIRKRQDLK